MKSCRTCRESLGGGHCRISLEKECCEGGGFEAWKPRVLFVDMDHFADYLIATKYTGAYTARLYGNKVRVDYKGEFTVG